MNPLPLTLNNPPDPLVSNLCIVVYFDIQGGVHYRGGFCKGGYCSLMTSTNEEFVGEASVRLP